MKEGCEHTLRLVVTTPATTDPSDVVKSLNAVLDEPPCDWGEWVVGAVTLQSIEQVDLDNDDDG